MRFCAAAESRRSRSNACANAARCASPSARALPHCCSCASSDIIARVHAPCAVCDFQDLSSRIPIVITSSANSPRRRSFHLTAQAAARAAIALPQVRLPPNTASGGGIFPIYLAACTAERNRLAEEAVVTAAPRSAGGHYGRRYVLQKAVGFIEAVHAQARCARSGQARCARAGRLAALARGLAALAALARVLASLAGLARLARCARCARACFLASTVLSCAPIRGRRARSLRSFRLHEAAARTL